MMCKCVFASISHGFFWDFVQAVNDKALHLWVCQFMFVANSDRLPDFAAFVPLAGDVDLHQLWSVIGSGGGQIDVHHS